MLGNIMDKIAGYKTYILATVGSLVAVAGYLWGPFHIGSIEIPHLSSSQMWDIIWNGGLFAALRHGVDLK